MMSLLRARAFLLGICLLPLLGGALGMAAMWADMEPSERLRMAAAVSTRLPLLLLFLSLGFVVAVVMAWRALGRLRREARALGETADLGVGLPQDAISPTLKAAGLLEPLAGPMARLIEASRSAHEEDTERLAAVRAGADQERNQLAALVAELPQAVIASNREGRILLYNERARQLFASGSGEASLVGLGRPIGDVFDRRLLAHARDRILASLAGGSSSALVSFVTSTAAGRLVRVRVCPVLAPGEAPAGERIYAHLLLSDDVTREAEQSQRRERLFEQLTDAQLGSLRVLQTQTRVLQEARHEQDRAAIETLLAESERMAGRIAAARSDFADVLFSATARERISARDLLLAAQRRIEARTGLATRIEAVESGLWLEVESFALIQVLTTLARRVLDACEAREVRLSLLSEDSRARLGLSWTGIALSSETAAGWEMEPMSLGGEPSPRSIRDVLSRHDGEILYERERASALSRFMLCLPAAGGEAEVADPSPKGRPEYYDFDLFAWGARDEAPDARSLAELAYTVFDTETTGLRPSEGDEIIQLGAVRIVKGKLLRGERFEQLVDPARAIDPASQRIHGIAREALVGQPSIAQVLPAFHTFARDTVLVGHNAAFDMRFLQMKEAETGIVFDQPVLDTLLLSAVLHPEQEDRRLEAIAERFGIAVVDRHQALADALLTAQLFLRMIPLLAGKGIVSLRDARTACEKTFYARLRY
ncbi:exonuclease domain-containing protein [Niveibacterium sp. SC-1]|uniref:3'-5' exonuclease n=1 Tax=Niveibacterium sp. SC-1 TaxID=3135646 RepID=UPI00311E777E